MLGCENVRDREKYMSSPTLSLQNVVLSRTILPASMTWLQYSQNLDAGSQWRATPCGRRTHRSTNGPGAPGVHQFPHS